MTALEMQYSFQQKFVEMNRGSIFTSYDIQNFLNEAQEILVNELSNNVEYDDKVRTYLSAITDIYTFTLSVTPVGEHPNGIPVTLPSNFFRCLKEQVELADGTRVKVKPQRHDYYNSNIDNPFKKPYESLYWRLDVGVDSSGNKIHEIITDGGSFKTYHMTYLTKPTDIDIINQVNCTLHESLHPAIVDKAVELALASLQRAGLIKQESNN